jgi:hypothetical protein
MRSARTILSCLALVLAPGATAQAQLFSDDFESHADALMRTARIPRRAR